MRFPLLLALGCALAAAPAVAAEDQPRAEQPAQAAAKNDPSSAIVCIYYYHEGNIIRRPYCRARHAWETEQKINQEDIRELQMKSLFLRN